MSYILEALKKAQAERQLGSAPTIHAAPLQPLASERERTRSMGLIVGLGLVAAALAGGVAWWTQRTPAPDAQPGAMLAATPAPPAQVVVVAQAPAPQQQQPVGMAQAAGTPPPLAYQAGPAPTPVMGASTVVAQRPPAMRAAPPSAPAPAPAPARLAVTAPVAVGAAPAAAPEENLPLLNQLPESQRAGLPQVTFGGYMYSKNPSDRLLLIDKTLRREGEEVAPGLVLERLLPRAAVMNYRGTRYRVPY